MQPGVGTIASWYFFIFGTGLKVSAALTPLRACGIFQISEECL